MKSELTTPIIYAAIVNTRFEYSASKRWRGGERSRLNDIGQLHRASRITQLCPNHPTLSESSNPVRNTQPCQNHPILPARGQWQALENATQRIKQGWPKPYARNHKPSTLDPQPLTLNPIRQPLNHKQVTEKRAGSRTAQCLCTKCWGLTTPQVAMGSNWTPKNS